MNSGVHKQTEKQKKKFGVWTFPWELQNFRAEAEV